MLQPSDSALKLIIPPILRSLDDGTSFLAGEFGARLRGRKWCWFEKGGQDTGLGAEGESLVGAVSFVRKDCEVGYGKSQGDAAGLQSC